MLACYAVALFSLMYAAYTDAKRRVIPDITVLLIAVSAVVKTFLCHDSLFVALASGVAVGGIMLSIAVIGKCDIGGGDIKLSAALGLFYGFVNTIGLSITALALLVVFGTFHKDEHLPYAPFLLAAIAAATLMKIYLGSD